MSRASGGVTLSKLQPLKIIVQRKDAPLGVGEYLLKAEVGLSRWGPSICAARLRPRRFPHRGPSRLRRKAGQFHFAARARRLAL